MNTSIYLLCIRNCYKFMIMQIATVFKGSHSGKEILGKGNKPT